MLLSLLYNRNADTNNPDHGKKIQNKIVPEDSSCKPSAILEAAAQDTKYMNVWKHGSQERMLEAGELFSWY
jgi:hypothetical protein